MEGRKKGEGGVERRRKEEEGPAATLLAAHRTSGGLLHSDGGGVGWGRRGATRVAQREDDARASVGWANDRRGVQDVTQCYVYNRNKSIGYMLENCAFELAQLTLLFGRHY